MNSLADLPARLRALPAVAPLIDVLGAAADVHVVGGAVRDLLLGGAPLDVDLVVEGDAAAAAGRLAAALGGAVTEHDRFGTATVLAGGHAYDLARARTETYARPGALPDVAFGSLADDLRRRDFTVNAIAVGLDGTVSATPNAFDDLAARRLRVLHDASFRDDPTRLLRLVRYATRLRFAVEEGTAALAAQALAGGALATVTPARIGGELRLLLRERAAAAALAWLASWGDALVPGFAFDAALAERARALLPAEGREDLLLLAVAVLGLEEAALRAWLDALGFPGRERDAVVAAATGARDAAARLSAARRPSEIAAALRGGPVELAALAGALGPAEPARRWIDELRQIALAIDGADLLAAGVPQGPAVGAALVAALDARLDGEAPDRPTQLAAALAAAAQC